TISGGGPILPEHLPQHLCEGGDDTLSMADHLPPASAGKVSDDDTPRTLKEIETVHLLKVVDKHKGKKQAAAEELGISLKTLYNKLNALEEERRSAGFRSPPIAMGGLRLLKTFPPAGAG